MLERDSIIRHCDIGPSVRLIVGADITEAEAERLVDAGQAEWREEELPPAVYLLTDLTIRRTYWAAGSLLQVGGEITRAEALIALRGIVGSAPIARPVWGVG